MSWSYVLEEVNLVPFRFELLKDFPLGVVADVLDVDEAAQIEHFRSEL